jgi:uncharacterized protein (DUF1501 family)
MKFTRRQFLKASAAVSAASTFPSIWWRARQAQALEACETGVNLVIVHLEGGNDGINMVIPMTDGTGQNRTAYDSVRTQLNVGAAYLTDTQVGNDPLQNGFLALHPHMTGLKSLYDAGNLAVLCGVHYPNPNLSHDFSSKIWYRADPTLLGPTTGWMGRTLDQLCTAQPLAVPAVDTESELTPLFYGNTSVMAFDDLSDLVFPISDDFDPPTAAAYKAKFSAIYSDAATAGPDFVMNLGSAGSATAAKVDAYGTANTGLANNLNALISGTGAYAGFGPQRFALAKGLRTVFALMKGQQPGNVPLGCRVFRVSITGFDTHSDEGGFTPFGVSNTIQNKVQNGFPGEYQGKLLYRLSAALSAFWQDLVDDGTLHTNTLIMTFSEFGRRVEENTNDTHAGTDHGTAAPVFVIGPKAGESTGPASLAGYGTATNGMYGGYPGLDSPNLDSDGNLVYQLDFRDLYGEIMSQWLGLPAATTNTILGGGYSYTPHGFLL